MDEIKYRNWRDVTGDAVRNAIMGCFIDHAIGGWQENTITRHVLQALGSIGAIHWTGQPFHCAWKAFKASGHFETANGDIAMRVTLQTLTGRHVTGTKYFEAKKLTLKSSRYDALDIAQLERMQLISGHEVLLYTLGRSADGVKTEALCLPTPVAVMLHTNHANALHSAAHAFIDVFSQALLGRGLNFDSRETTAFDKQLASMEASFVLDANVAPLEVELEPMLAPSGYRELDDREPDPSDDLMPY